MSDAETVGILYCATSPDPTGFRCFTCRRPLAPDLTGLLELVDEPSLMTMCEPCADHMVGWIAGLPGGGGLR